MPDSVVIDSHVHVGRNQPRWETVRPSLEALGIETAVLSADPESYDLAGDRGIGGDLSRPGGPYGLWYVGGNPFSGRHRSDPLLPQRLDDYQGVGWHCYFSDGHDYGSADEVAAAAARDFLQSPDAEDALDAMAEIAGCGLPIRLTESLPFTLALIDRYPDGTFIIPHMGLRNGGVSRVLNALSDNPRVHFDTSVVEPNEGMIGTVGAERVLFGSDAPSGDPARAIRDVRKLNIPSVRIAAILGENARRLFDPEARR